MRTEENFKPGIAPCQPAETKPHASEEKFRTLFENALAAIFLVRDGRFTECNVRALGMFGCQTHQQILGRAPADFSPALQSNGQSSREFAAEKLAAAQSGQPQFFEWTLMRHDGTLFPAEVSLNRLQPGETPLVQAIIRDVTERKRIEEDLRRQAALLKAETLRQQQTEMRMAAIINSTQDLIWSVDATTWRLTVFNKSLRDNIKTHFGVDLQLGMLPEEILPPDKVWRWRDYYRQILARGELKVEYFSQEFGRHHEIRFNLIRQEGQATGISVFAKDVTERKRIEQELERHRAHLEDLVMERTAELEISRDKTEAAYQKLRALEKQRGDLVHMVVHDMRSPLTGLGLFLGALSPAEMNTPDFEENLCQMRETCRALSSLVTSLLDISRMEAGRMPLHCEVSDLGQLTNATLKRLSGQIQGRHISVRAEATVWAYCDPVITERIFENLLGNALKFTPENGSIRIELSMNETWASFLIADTGPGIPVEYHAKVFEKFGQVEIHKDRKAPSSGLGLTFCKLAVEAQGGSIRLESKPGRGTTFRVRLPKHGAGAGPTNAALNPPDPGTQSGPTCL